MFTKGGVELGSGEDNAKNSGRLHTQGLLCSSLLGVLSRYFGRGLRNTAQTGTRSEGLGGDCYRDPCSC